MPSLQFVCLFFARKTTVTSITPEDVFLIIKVSIIIVWNSWITLCNILYVFYTAYATLHVSYSGRFYILNFLSNNLHALTVGKEVSTLNSRKKVWEFRRHTILWLQQNFFNSAWINVLIFWLRCYRRCLSTLILNMDPWGYYKVRFFWSLYSSSFFSLKFAHLNYFMHANYCNSRFANVELHLSRFKKNYTDLLSIFYVRHKFNP